MWRKRIHNDIMGLLLRRLDCMDCFQGIIELILFGWLGCILVCSKSCLYRHHNSNNNSGNIQTAKNHYYYYGDVSFGPVFIFGGPSGGSSSSGII
jgi:hypothetical protein